MTDLFTRRFFLSRAPAAVAAVALPVTAAAAVVAPDPIIALVDRHVALWPLCPGDDDEAGNIRWNAEINQIEAEIAEVLPTTRAGALAVVRFVASQLAGFVGEDWMARALAASADILEREG